jgi:hypothetical protein
MSTDQELAGDETILQEIGDRLMAQHTPQPDRGVIANECEALSAALAHLRVVAQQVSSWTDESPELVRIDARADENLALAGLALESANGADVAQEMLYAAHDAVFHAQRSIGLMRRLEHEGRERTRQLDRDKNRREFLSG